MCYTSRHGATSVQVAVLVVQSTQAVPTLTLFDMLRVQALWLWNHSAIVAGVVTGAWKLSKSIKHLPERITGAITARMDAHEKLDNERELHVRQALADAREVTDEKWNSMKASIEQININLSRMLRGGDAAD